MSNKWISGFKSRRAAENLGLLAFTLGLYFLTLKSGLFQWLLAEVHLDSTGEQRLRSIGLEAHMLVLPQLTLVEKILTFGLCASIGLSLFALLQARRLRLALGQQQQAEQKARALALRDPLTGLGNRRQFEATGEAILRREEGTCRAVFLIDLDHFKPVNDVHGHAAGDLVLREYAERLAPLFPGGLVARFGGDEFAVITPPLLKIEEADLYAQHCIDAVREAFIYNGASLHIGASVGMSFLDKKARGVADALRRADIALYTAKNSGRMQYAAFEEALEEDAIHRNWMKNGLRRALEEMRIVPYFQPIVDLKTKEITGYEALARWDDPERGPISPADFIPVAEEMGLIGLLGEQVLAQAAQIARKWPAEISLSVNLSPVQLRDPQLALRLIGILDEAGFPPQRLEVEITENALVNDLEAAKDTILQLRAAGIRIALDDFGTGHSTLNHLVACRFDKIKIDQRFVRMLNADRESQFIVDAILGLSRQFGIDCIAEGIENAEDAQILQSWGCRSGQGYLFGRPASGTAYTNDTDVQVKGAA